MALLDVSEIVDFCENLNEEEARNYVEDEDDTVEVDCRLEEVSDGPIFP